MSERHLSPVDRLLADLQRGLATLDPATRSARGDYPAADPDTLAATERSHVAGLMRVNHAGEVAAQALYRGQAQVASRPDVRAQLLEAAEEEQAHLQWCEQRLSELDSAPSRLGPAWFAGAYAIGALAGLAGDRWSLGFVAETERQVEEHLNSHLQRLPETDARSRAVVTRMRDDEARHAEDAVAAGGAPLPGPVRGLMRLAAKVMTRTAYRV